MYTLVNARSRMEIASGGIIDCGLGMHALATVCCEKVVGLVWAWRSLSGMDLIIAGITALVAACQCRLL